MSRLRSRFSSRPAPHPDRNLGARTRVNENVVLVRPLADGAMGAVWVAQHETLKTEVAVKFIGDALSVDDPEVLARFNREASTAAQIKSPYVVQTFDQGVTSEGLPYIVMELLEGESLLDNLERNDRLTFEQAEIIIAQVGKALAAAHARGIVHRDIKPGNIFLTRVAGDLHVKVLDFGIAKKTDVPKLEGITEAGGVIGTPEFMSPEQLFNAEHIDHRADLWALGVVAYCCMTGQLPFEAETLPQLCKCLIHCRFPKASEHREGLPEAVDAWFEKALHQDIEQRFRTAKEMAVTFVRVMAAARLSEEASALEELFITTDGDVPPLPAPPLPTPKGESTVVDESSKLLVPVPEKRKAGPWIILAVIAVLATAAFVFRDALSGPLAATPETGAPAVATEPSSADTAPTIAAPTIVEPPPRSPASSTSEEAPAPPTEVDGRDADAWQRVLAGAVVRDNAQLAAESFMALAKLAPGRFDDVRTAKAGAKAAALAAADSEAFADAVFSVIEGDAFGHHGADILYQITSHHRGSAAAKRATKLLADEQFLARATPAMRIALQLRDASCESRPALFGRAAKDGDARSLYILVAMRGSDCKRISCCLKDNPQLIAAINAIHARNEAN